MSWKAFQGEHVMSYQLMGNIQLMQVEFGVCSDSLDFFTALVRVFFGIEIPCLLHASNELPP